MEKFYPFIRYLKLNPVRKFKKCMKLAVSMLERPYFVFKIHVFQDASNLFKMRVFPSFLDKIWVHFVNPPPPSRWIGRGGGGVDHLFSFLHSYIFTFLHQDKTWQGASDTKVLRHGKSISIISTEILSKLTHYSWCDHSIKQTRQKRGMGRREVNKYKRRSS